MTIPYTQDLSVVIDVDDLYAAVREFGGAELSVLALIEHLRQARPTVRRVLRRIHAVFGAKEVSDDILVELRRHQVDLHFGSAGRPDVSVFAHAHRATETSDVVALIVGKKSYLPLLRHIKEHGARVELHAGPSANPALFPAADGVIALPSTIVNRAPERERVVALA